MPGQRVIAPFCEQPPTALVGIAVVVEPKGCGHAPTGGILANLTHEQAAYRGARRRSVGEDDVSIEHDELEEREPGDGRSNELPHLPAAGKVEGLAGSGIDDHWCALHEQFFELVPRPPVDDVGIGMLEPADPHVMDCFGYLIIMKHGMTLSAISTENLGIPVILDFSGTLSPPFVDTRSQRSPRARQ